MNFMKRAAYFLLLVISGLGCKKPYNPPAITGNAGYLVVEGVINSGSDSTIIKLSKTVNVSGPNAISPVLNAVVAVVSDQGVNFPLTETASGNYVAVDLNLDKTHQYRLSIKTSDNKQYQSDLVPPTVTPPIDSIGYNIINTAGETGIQIYVNTHDPANTLKYYRWDYDEAWAFRAKYISFYVSNGTTLVVRQPDQDVSYCYANDVSSTIVLGSSAKLKQDVLYQSPIIFIASTSEKIESEYSILLRQYALTADAYNFWTGLKKNTEQLGSIFDAQPSQLQGNIHCLTNPSEPVIGYISVCKVSSKRIFISNINLPAWVPTYPYDCSDYNVKFDTVHTYGYNFYNDLVNDAASFLATGPPPLPGNALPSIINYTHRYCADCTIRGTTKAPSFWK
jgi:hypothetical protein